MDIAVVISLKDPAGLNIKSSLIEQGLKKADFQFKENEVFFIKEKVHNLWLYTIETDSILAENLDKEIKADLFMFATKHQSKAGVNSYTVHSIGNFGKAEFGGQDNTLYPSPGEFLRQGLFALTKHNPGSHEVIQEATHHGPQMSKQSMFIEIGSSLAEWTNHKNGKVLASSIIDLMRQSSRPGPTAFGIGGLHHSPNFKKLIFEQEISFTHICTKYNLPFLDENLLKQALETSVPKAKLIAVDWKGLGTEKARIKQLVEQSGTEWFKI